MSHNPKFEPKQKPAGSRNFDSNSENQDWQVSLADAELEKLDEICKKKGRDFKPIKTHQIRSFFASVNRLKNQIKKGENEKSLRDSLVMMGPSLAYAKGRHKEIEPMYDFFIYYIDQVKKASGELFQRNLQRFIFIAEAVVAYHRFYGGKD